MDETEHEAVLAGALRLLARREHTAAELHRKLSQRGFAEQAIADVLASLAEEGLQSDARFVEHYVRSQAERGVGPGRIEAALQERGITDRNLIGSFLDYNDECWLAQAQAVREKKFGAGLPGTQRERLRQARFLQGRGFTAEQIFRILEDEE